MATVGEVTDGTFEAEVLRSSKPVVVDYWAAWCSPCLQMNPILDELARDHGDTVTFLKLNTNDNPLTPAQQGVLGLPTVQLFADGRLVKSCEGAKTKGQLLKALDEYL